MIKNEKQNYKQIRLSFNLNRKEDIEVYNRLVKDVQKPSKVIIDLLHQQLNITEGIHAKLSAIEEAIKNINVLVLNNESQQHKSNEVEAVVTFDFDNIELDGIDFL